MSRKTNWVSAAPIPWLLANLSGEHEATSDRAGRLSGGSGGGELSILTVRVVLGQGVGMPPGRPASGGPGGRRAPAGSPDGAPPASAGASGCWPGRPRPGVCSRRRAAVARRGRRRGARGSRRVSPAAAVAGSPSAPGTGPHKAASNLGQLGGTGRLAGRQAGPCSSKCSASGPLWYLVGSLA